MTGIQKKKMWHCPNCKKNYPKPVGHVPAVFCSIHPTIKLEIVLVDNPITKEEFSRLLQSKRLLPKWFKYEGHRGAYAFRVEFGKIFNDMYNTYVETKKIVQPSNPNPGEERVHKRGRPKVK